MDIDRLVADEREYFRPMLERSRQASEQQRAEWREETIRERQARISREVFEMTGGQVRHGPFSGMRLSGDTWWGELDLGSQCLGLYEKELLDVIEAMEPGQFDAFIDIGAADGYYAVGVLHAHKVHKCICFEQSPEGRRAIEENWQRNGSPGDLAIHAEANLETISKLQGADIGRALVVVDIEGFEFTLLQPQVLELLSSCTVIVEIHNWVENFLERYEQLLRNAARHFDVSFIERTERQTSHLPELRDFTDDNRLLLTSERRPCLMRFLKLEPFDH